MTTRHIYREFNHPTAGLVWKNAGLTTDKKHEDFFLKHFSKEGRDAGPSYTGRVMAIDGYRGDRITQRDGLWIRFED